MAISDVIEREMVLPSPRSEVWTALTTAEGLEGWWADRVEVDSASGTMRFHFSPEYGVGEAQIDVLDPEDRFAFFWRPFASKLPEAEQHPDLRTRVEFTLSDHPDGTALTMRETGFASLPSVLAAQSFADNEGGWTEELEHLRRYLATGVAVVHG